MLLFAAFMDGNVFFGSSRLGKIQHPLRNYAYFSNRVRLLWFGKLLSVCCEPSSLGGVSFEWRELVVFLLLKSSVRALPSLRLILDSLTQKCYVVRDDEECLVRKMTMSSAVNPWITSP